MIHWLWGWEWLRSSAEIGQWERTLAELEALLRLIISRGKSRLQTPHEHLARSQDVLPASFDESDCSGGRIMVMVNPSVEDFLVNVKAVASLMN